MDVAGGESCTSSRAHETFITSSPVLCLRFLYSLWKSFVVYRQVLNVMFSLTHANQDCGYV